MYVLHLRQSFLVYTRIPYLVSDIRTSENDYNDKQELSRTFIRQISLPGKNNCLRWYYLETATRSKSMKEDQNSTSKSGLAQ